MANIKLKFLDSLRKDDFIQTELENVNGVNYIKIFGYDSTFCDADKEYLFEIYLDKSTAIKFAKTLRTEINKITESEVSNG